MADDKKKKPRYSTSTLKEAWDPQNSNPSEEPLISYEDEPSDPKTAVKQMGNKDKAKMHDQAIAAGGFSKTGPGRKIQGSFKKGGRVRKTGIYKLHKGEKVVPVKKVGRKR